MAQPQVLEGIREEIMALLARPEVAGRRFRLIVMPEEGQPDRGAYQPDSNHFYFQATDEEFEGAFDSSGKGNEGLPILPPEAFERESIYEDVP